MHPDSTWGPSGRSELNAEGPKRPLGEGRCIKAIVAEASGTILGEGTASYPVRLLHPGWAESDPLDWWEACAEPVRAAVGDAAHRSRRSGSSARCMAWFSQMPWGTPRDRPYSGPIPTRLACLAATASSTPGCATGWLTSSPGWPVPVFCDCDEEPEARSGCGHSTESRGG